MLLLAVKCRLVVYKGQHFNVICKTNFNSNLSVKQLVILVSCEIIICVALGKKSKQAKKPEASVKKKVIQS